MAVHVDRYSSSDDIQLGDHLKIKYKVFCEEIGWQLPVERRFATALPDNFDNHGRFVSAYEFGACVGTVRWLPVWKGFPHARLFCHHLDEGVVQKEFNNIATINSLCVLPSYRGRKVRMTGHTVPITCGKALMLESVGWMRQEGVTAVFASTEPGVALQFFVRLGFYIIDRPSWDGASERTIVNIALAIYDQDRFEECRSIFAKLYDRTKDMQNRNNEVITYFRQMQVNAIGALTHDDVLSRI